MAELRSSLIVRLLDGVTRPAKGIATALMGIDKAAAGVGRVPLGQRIGAAIEANNQALAGMRYRLLDAVGGFYILKRALGAPIEAAVSFESAMADVRKVTNFNTEGIKGFGKELRGLATKEIPMSVTELAALASAAAQAGVPDEDLKEFTRTTAKSAVAWEMTGAQTGEALAKIRSALGLTNKQVELYADAVNYLADNTASSADELVDYSRRVVAQGEFFGFAKEETLAFGAAMIGTGAQAEVAATSFRNMGRALTKGGSATKRQSRAFQKLGLDAQKVAKSMQKDAVGTTLDVMDRLGKLPDYLQASVMSDLFGDEARALAPLLNNVNEIRRVLGLVNDETKYAGSVAREFAIRSKTAANNWQLFKNRLNDVAIVIGDALIPSLNAIMDTLGPVILAVSDLAAAHPTLTKAIVGTTLALLAFRVGGIAMRFVGLNLKGAVLSIAGAFVKLGNALRAATITPMIGILTRVAGVAQIAALRFRMMGAAARAGEIGLAGIARGTAATVTRALMGLLNPLALVRGALFALRVAVIGTGIGAIVVGLAMAGTWIYNNWSKLTAMFEGFGAGFKAALAPVMPVLQPVVDGVSWLWDTFSSLTGTVSSSESEWRTWGETIGGVVGGAVRELIGLFKALGDNVSWAWNKAKSWFGFGGGKSSDAPAGSGKPVAGARAKGGPVFAGRSYLVGENHPEIFTPNSNGRILTGTGGGKPSVTFNNTFHFNGVKDAEEIIREVKRRLNTELSDLMQGIYSDFRTA